MKYKITIKVPIYLTYTVESRSEIEAVLRVKDIYLQDARFNSPTYEESTLCSENIEPENIIKICDKDINKKYNK